MARIWGSSVTPARSALCSRARAVQQSRLIDSIAVLEKVEGGGEGRVLGQLSPTR
jgi:hypothetical protein